MAETKETQEGSWKDGGDYINLWNPRKIYGSKTSKRQSPKSSRQSRAEGAETRKF